MSLDPRLAAMRDVSVQLASAEVRAEMAEERAAKLESEVAALRRELSLLGNPETGSTGRGVQGEAGHPTDSTLVEPVSGRRDALSFADLRATNVARCEEHYHPVDAWSFSDWLTAVAGELGELAGVVKNIRRRADERGNSHAIPETTVDHLADEAADVVIYLDLLCARADVDLGAAVRRKFNRVSIERLKNGPLLPVSR